MQPGVGERVSRQLIPEEAGGQLLRVRDGIQGHEPGRRRGRELTPTIRRRPAPRNSRSPDSPIEQRGPATPTPNRTSSGARAGLAAGSTTGSVSVQVQRANACAAGPPRSSRPKLATSAVTPERLATREGKPGVGTRESAEREISCERATLYPVVVTRAPAPGNRSGAASRRPPLAPLQIPGCTTGSSARAMPRRRRSQLRLYVPVNGNGHNRARDCHKSLRPRDG
jgi:hypothetical protein